MRNKKLFVLFYEFCCLYFIAILHFATPFTAIFKKSVQRSEQITAKSVQRSEQITAKNVQRSEQITAKSVQRSEQISVKSVQSAEQIEHKEGERHMGLFLSDVRLRQFFISSISWHLFSPWQSSSKLGSAHLA